MKYKGPIIKYSNICALSNKYIILRQQAYNIKNIINYNEI